MPDAPRPPAASTLTELSQQLVQTSAERDALRTERDTLRSERDTFRQLYLEMLAQNRKLELGVVGHGRERDLGDPNQITLAMLGMMTGASAPAAPPAETEKEKVREHVRAKPTGRQVLPEKLPRVDVTVLPPEVQARGTEAFEQIGEDVTETVERRPAALVVVRVHKPKFVEKERDLKHDVKVHQAPPPPLPIERGLAGPGLLADTVVRRWEEHMPLHRLERSYGRDGLELSRSTMCDWHAALAELVKPLIAAMWKDAFKAPYLCVDATGVLVQALEKCRTAHFFVVAAPERHVLFGFSPKHNAAAVDALLAGYEGYLVLDAHSVYEHLFKNGKVFECGCWSHVRRYFFKALGSDPPRARRALGFIRQLFELEEKLKPKTAQERLAVRQVESKAVLDAFEKWCDEEAGRVLDETPIAKALGYARNQREALRRFLEDGRLPIHNNWSERELRREAVGRNNWLFVGSDEGGVVNATHVSLLASCRLHELNPHEYLRDLYCLLPEWPVQRVLELAPAYWKATVAREEVQRMLDENIYRRVSLGLL